MSTKRAELLNEALIPAVEVMDGGHHGVAIGDKSGHHESRTDTQIGRGDLGSGESVHAVHHRMMALHTDVRAHANELGGEHEAVLEDVLRNDGIAVGKGG